MVRSKNNYKIAISASIGFLIMGILLLIICFFIKNIEGVFAKDAQNRDYKVEIKSVSYEDFAKDTANIENFLSLKGYNGSNIARDNVPFFEKENNAKNSMCSNPKVSGGTASLKPYMIRDINTSDTSTSGGQKTSEIAMLYNTWFLQAAMACSDGSVEIALPTGVYYFVSGHEKKTPYGQDLVKGYNPDLEYNVIRMVSHTTVKGQGANENSPNNEGNTVLKPYSESGWMPNGGGLDMFLFNDYATSRNDGNYDTPQENASFLDDVRYSDMIIDSEKTIGSSYNTSGKGFLVVLTRDSHWDNVVVKNTDGTGFGIDEAINSTINNCTARNCGKAVPQDNFDGGIMKNSGGSGFGIGTGYSNDESLLITNSRAYGNGIFGFFFEDQSRFNHEAYRATTAKGFSVSNCYSEGNYYNYGGLRANDVEYANSKSVNAKTLNIYFSDESRRISIKNMDIDKVTFEDVDSSDYFYDAVLWATKNDITHGVIGDKFGVGEKTTRQDALVLLWRMSGREGDVISKANNNIGNTRGADTNFTNQRVKTCFSDVKEYSYYAGAIKWGYDNNITMGTSSCSDTKAGTFGIDESVKREDFVVMLWRLAGMPQVSTANNYDDVENGEYYSDAIKWATSAGIVNGISEHEFGVGYDCTREQVITLMYRYANKYNI